MTQSEFVAACVELCIDPGIAIENEQIVEALRERDDEEVLRTLREDF